ncbi:lactosylceramide 4-alpha-galactosyltransferase [Nephila pilipes]|uniref:Lactosylceramide 4-alpha-galactosyltransferase n=1 Tax=Nephila pilipes TaxID=299642 RepID=A0A8X6QQ35_NEPPI|nr:lactosylceramide 4-alpha-galactosyltransferase [Nephila pilipes]
MRTRDGLTCIEENAIFFVESSDSRQLTARQACAIESAARHHPDRQVRVLMTSPDPLKRKDNFTGPLELLENVRLFRVDFGHLMFDTPLWYWYIRGKWKTSPFKVLHISDALRLCIIWRYGGLYLDLDVVVLQSLSNLRNTTTTDNGKNVATALLAFDPGHPLLQNTIRDYASHYAPKEFAKNGPLLLNKNFKKMCGVTKVDEVRLSSVWKCDVNVLPMEAAYPIPYKRWVEYFKPQATPNESAFNSSVVIHVWNKLSNGGRVVIGQNSLYEMAMKHHCPTTYEYATNLGFV